MSRPERNVNGIEALVAVQTIPRPIFATATGFESDRLLRHVFNWTRPVGHSLGEWRAKEALWQEISKEDPALESPAWHGEVLEQTRSRVAAGTAQIVDWDEAKRRLRSPD